MKTFTQTNIILALLREYRIGYGYTQTDIAKKLGYSTFTTWSKIESGGISMRVSTLITVCKLFDRDIGGVCDDSAFLTGLLSANGWTEVDAVAIHGEYTDFTKLMKVHKTTGLERIAFNLDRKIIPLNSKQPNTTMLVPSVIVAAIDLTEQK